MSWEIHALTSQTYFGSIKQTCSVFGGFNNVADVCRFNKNKKSNINSAHQWPFLFCDGVKDIKKVHSLNVVSRDKISTQHYCISFWCNTLLILWCQGQGFFFLLQNGA